MILFCTGIDKVMTTCHTELGAGGVTPQVQIKAGLRYIYKRYDTPCGAWEFWKRKAGKDLRGGWY
jgi:hypothetical protein